MYEEYQKVFMKYTANKRSWMTSNIFENEIKLWDEKLRRQNRKNTING